MTKDELDSVLMDRFGIDSSDLEFLVWFISNVDLGPAHDDVYDCLVNQYEKTHHIPVSVRFDWRKEQV